MSYKSRLTERTVTIKAPAAGTYVLWRATLPCKVKAVRAYRVGGTTADVQATKNGANLLASNLLTPAASTWATGTMVTTVPAPPAVPVFKVLPGDTISAVVVGAVGAPTDLTIQIDIEIDANA